MVATTMPMACAVIGLVSSTVSLSPYQTTFVITKVVPPTIANRTISRCLMINARNGAGNSLNMTRTTDDTTAVYEQPPERVHPVTLSARLRPFGLAVKPLSMDCQQSGHRGSSSGRHSPGSVREGGGVLLGDGLVVVGDGVVVVVTGGGVVVVWAGVDGLVVCFGG